MLLLERQPRDNPINRFFTARTGPAADARLAEAIEIVRSSGVLDVSMDMAREYVRRADEAIAPLAGSDAHRCLVELGDYVLQRRS